MKIIATAAAGLEAVVAMELRAMGHDDVTVRPGKAEIEGDWETLARLNLWLRSAERVKLKVGSFPATSFEALFEGSSALPWADLLPVDAAFPVVGRSARSVLHSVPDCQAIVKKAVVEALKRRHQGVTWFAEDGPAYRIEVAVHDDVAELTVDASGDGLHRRGYRRLVSEAPLRETLAAGILILSRWRVAEEALADLFCGSGTFAIEAAMIARRQAPGLRRRFASMQWPQIGLPLWRRLQQEAQEQMDSSARPDILAMDLAPAMVDLARRNAAAAGVEALIRFATGDARRWTPDRPRGLVLGNPPYGQRMSDQREAAALARDLGERHRAAGAGWRAFWLSALPDWETRYGRTADRRRKLYNAGIAAQLYQYKGP